MQDQSLAKQDEMRSNGTFNHRADSVSAQIFSSSRFFDAYDIVQVKYEMLRAVEKGNCDISSTAEVFGFSRVSFYQIKKVFDEKGIVGLFPKKRGPKGSRKLTDSDIEFAKNLESTHTKAQIVTRLRDERSVEISKRTLERGLSAKKNS